MGKEKIEEKDVRLLRYAVEQAFDGAMRDGALTLLNRLVDSASEAANLEEELLNLKGEYQRSMENSKRGAFKRLHAAYKRKCRREKRMAKGQMLCADGKPVCYIYRQQEGLTERTPAWATSRRPTDEVRSSSHSRSASTTRSFRLANTKAGTRRTGSQGNVRRRGFGALSTGLQLQMVVASGSRFRPAR